MLCSAGQCCAVLCVLCMYLCCAVLCCVVPYVRALQGAVLCSAGSADRTVCLGEDRVGRFCRDDFGTVIEWIMCVSGTVRWRYINCTKRCAQYSGVSRGAAAAIGGGDVSIQSTSTTATPFRNGTGGVRHHNLIAPFTTGGRSHQRLRRGVFLTCSWPTFAGRAITGNPSTSHFVFTQSGLGLYR